MAVSENEYSDPGLDRDATIADDHRTFVGGMWDTLGELQFDVMVARGLIPSHTFIDVGCGSMRGGRYFIPYLAPGHYYGFDLIRPLIDAGLEHEIKPMGLIDRVDMDHIAAAEGFAFPDGWRGIERGLALSLFSHLSLNSIQLCLRSLRAIMSDDAEFYASIFLTTQADQAASQTRLDGIVTHMCRDPFHYSRADMDYVASASGWRVMDITPFDHPRGQTMVGFAAI